MNLMEQSGQNVTGAERAQGALSSVTVALRVLMAFRTTPSLGVTQVANMLSISRSTAHRMLSTLESMGFVVQDQGTRAYRTGPVLTEISLVALGEFGLNQTFKPFLRQVVSTTGETAHLAMLSGRSALFLDAIESPATIRAGSRVTTALPAECCAIGRAILSTFTDEQVRTLYPTDGALTKLSRASPDRVADLLDRLEEVRQRGWALNLGETEAGLHAVAVPLQFPSVLPVLALSATGPAARLPEHRLHDIGRELVAIARRIMDVLALTEKR